MRGLDRRALAMLATTVVLLLVMIPLAAGQEDALDTVLYSTLPLMLAAVGALIASRHPENPIGWLFCGLGLWVALAELAEAYGYQAHDHGLPAGVAGEWLISWSWLVEVPVWVSVILTFPDGRLPGRRWRLAVWLALAGAVVVFVGQAFSDDDKDYVDGRNPLGVDSAWIDAAWPIGTVLLAIAVVAAVVSLVRRYRRARGVEREQLKWFASAGVILAVAVCFGAALWYQTVLVQAFFALAVNAMVVAVGVAILRYRLYDIDVVINRTVVYGALTVTLAATYVSCVLLLQLVLSPGSDIAIAASTLAVAAVFRPARARIQAAVDRRFYRRRYDAQRTLEGFAARLRDAVALEHLSAELRTVVAETMQPAHVSLWVRER